jgi:hypothetical protein
MDSVVVWLQIPHYLAIFRALFNHSNQFTMGGLDDLLDRSLAALTWFGGLKADEHDVTVECKAKPFTLNDDVFR